jgi:multiple sugar transport system permease protein
MAEIMDNLTNRNQGIRKGGSLKWSKRSARFLSYLFLALVLIFLFFPVYWMVSTSLKSRADTFAIPPQIIPIRPTLAAFYSLKDENFFVYVKNSAIVASLTTLITVVVASLSSYSFTRLRTKTASVVFYSILATQMFPLSVLIIPIYIIISRIKLYNTFAGLIISYLAFALPFCIWYLRSYFEKIPIEIEEAALIDGCTRPQILSKIIAPLSLPGIVATAFFAFLTSWDEFLFALTLTNRNNMRTVPPGLVISFVGEFGYRWPEMMAASLTISLPVVILFLLFSRYIISGLTEGSIK